VVYNAIDFSLELKTNKRREPPMKMKFLFFPFFIAFLLVAGCDSKNESPETKPPMTDREKAAVVGKAGDRAVTKTLEKDLVGVVDSAEEREKMLEETSQGD
jgi:hypothetical protein